MSILTPEEIAQRWQVSAVSVYRLLQNKQLKGFKVGKLWRIPEANVEQYEKGE